MGNTAHRSEPSRYISVHPHERGEYAGGEGGSLRHIRFIPTNVGNTTGSTSKRSHPAVHPHERGEYGLRLSRAESLSGSSPRTWGIRSDVVGKLYLKRFIPTNVGNTRPPEICRPPVSVHPHERGEYGYGSGDGSGYGGSSPRTWGILRRPCEEWVG